MEFEIKDAAPDHQPIILGLTGPSGSGKTFSALLLAHGIQDVAGGKIVGIDTEGRRMLRYADKRKFPDFNFKHMNLQPPFSSDRYADAIRSAAELLDGKGTVIIDSMSLEHEGPGGYLEFHEKELDRMAGQDYKKREKMTFTAWIKPAAARRRLINSFLQVPMNFIFCFRAKEKLKIISGASPVSLGWQAIAGEEFVYEMIVRALLPPGSKGQPDWTDAAFQHGAAKRDAQDAYIFPDDKPITREMGRVLAKAYGGGSDIQPRQAVGTGETTLTKEQRVENKKTELRDAAAKGTAALMEQWDWLNADQQRYFKDFYDADLLPAAQAADFNNQPQGDPL